MMDAWLEVTAKAVVYAAALLAVGVAVSYQLLRHVAGNPAFPTSAAAPVHRVSGSAARKLDTLLAISAVVMLCALAMRAVGHSVAAFGWTDGLTWENVRLIAVESGWGAGWKVQAAAAVLFAVNAVAVRVTGGTPARIASLVTSAVVCVSLPRTGHAASSASTWLLHSVHALAAGCWVGTIVAVLWLHEPGTRALRVQMFRSFAPIAMTAAGLLTLSGAVAGFNYVATIDDLFGTEYGRLLLAKVTLVVLMLVLGGRNYRSLRSAENITLPGTVFGEAAIATLVVIVTTWLTETAHP